VERVLDRKLIIHHNIRIAAVNAKRQKIQRTTGPDAPRNSKPNALNSIGPVAYLRSNTTQSEAIAANGKPIVAAKCFFTISTIQLLSLHK